MFSSFFKSPVAKYLLSLMVLGCLLVFPLFLPGFYVSHDGELQLGRIPAYARELFSGQVPVRWSSDLNYGYGSPIFSFIYPLPYWLAAVLYLANPSAIFALKATLLLTFLSSGLAFFYYVYLWKKDSNVAFLSAAVYLFLPYRMLNIYTRVAFGEAVAFLFPPLIMLSGLYLARQDFKKGIWMTAMSVAGLILTHNAMALIFVGPLFLWFFISNFSGLHQKKQLTKTTLYYLGSWLSGLLLAAFFWMPALLEKKYTMVELFLKTKDFHEYFLSLPELLHQSWFVTGTTAPAFWGVTGLIMFALSLYSIAVKKKNLEVYALLGFLLVALYMTTPYSTFFWEHLPFLPFFQLPWRFLSLAVWATALLVPFAIQGLRYRTAVSVISMLVLVWEVLPITKTLHKLEMTDAYFQSYPGSTTWHEEGTPIWTAGSPSAHPTTQFVTDQAAEVTSGISSSTKYEFVITTTQQSTFVLQHFYFPGWRAKLNDQEVPIEFQDMNYRGLMKVAVPSGTNRLEFSFTRTKIRLVAEVVSLLGLCLLLGMSVILRKSENRVPIV